MQQQIMIILLIWIAVLIGVLVIYFRQVYSRFKKYGVKHDSPVPIVGNMTRTILRLDNFAEALSKLYNNYPEERFIGRFEFSKEIVIIRDLELVKQITIKDVEYFLDHRSFFSESQSFFARNLFSLKGQEWKDMRSTLSPAFTSSKIRLMVPFMVEVGDQMIAILKNKINDSDKDYIVVDCKDLTTRYANDVIASCAFGLKVNSLADTDNEFYIRGKETSMFSFAQFLMFFLIMNLPTVAKILNWDFMSQGTKDFFRNLILGPMKERELKHIVRHDMVHLLMQAKKGSLKHENSKIKDDAAGFATVEESEVGRKEIKRVWTDDDIIAQAVQFFVAGFETASSGMCFLLYELAVNPDVQNRLAEEIREHNAKNCGKFDFNSIQTMTYLDMVVSGSRFALCELKALTYQILLHMEISPCETTCIPAKLSTESFNIRLQGGHQLRFRLMA